MRIDSQVNAMTMRLDADEAVYQAARAHHQTIPLHQEENVREYRHWRIVKNRFPHTKIADQHHMIVLKRESEIDELTVAEWREFLRIIMEVRDQYDNLVYNLPSMTSVKHMPHFHLYCLKNEFRCPPGQQASNGVTQ